MLSNNLSKWNTSRMEEKIAVEKTVGEKCVGRNYLGNLVVEDRITYRGIL